MIWIDSNPNHKEFVDFSVFAIWVFRFHLKIFKLWQVYVVLVNFLAFSISNFSGTVATNTRKQSLIGFAIGAWFKQRKPKSRLIIHHRQTRHPAAKIMITWSRRRKSLSMAVVVITILEVKEVKGGIFRPKSAYPLRNNLGRRRNLRRRRRLPGKGSSTVVVWRGDLQGRSQRKYQMVGPSQNKCLGTRWEGISSWMRSQASDWVQ